MYLAWEHITIHKFFTSRNLHVLIVANTTVTADEETKTIQTTELLNTELMSCIN